jgi:hypothetical protein
VSGSVTWSAHRRHARCAAVSGREAARRAPATPSVAASPRKDFRPVPTAASWPSLACTDPPPTPASWAAEGLERPPAAPLPPEIGQRGALTLPTRSTADDSRATDQPPLCQADPRRRTVTADRTARLGGSSASARGRSSADHDLHRVGTGTRAAGGRRRGAQEAVAPTGTTAAARPRRNSTRAAAALPVPRSGGTMAGVSIRSLL